MTSPDPHPRELPNSVVIRPAALADAPGLARVLIDAGRAAHRGQVPDRLLDTPPLARQYAASTRNWRRTLRQIAAARVPGAGLRRRRPRRGRGRRGPGHGRPLPAPGARVSPLRRGGQRAVRRAGPPGAGRGPPARAGGAAAPRRRRPAVRGHPLPRGERAGPPLRRVPLGGRQVGETVYEERGVRLPEVVYGWPAPAVARLLDEFLRAGGAAGRCPGGAQLRAVHRAGGWCSLRPTRVRSVGCARGLRIVLGGGRRSLRASRPTYLRRTPLSAPGPPPERRAGADACAPTCTPMPVRVCATPRQAVGDSPAATGGAGGGGRARGARQPVRKQQAGGASPTIGSRSCVPLQPRAEGATTRRVTPRVTHLALKTLGSAVWLRRRGPADTQV